MSDARQAILNIQEEIRSDREKEREVKVMREVGEQKVENYIINQSKRYRDIKSLGSLLLKCL